MGKLYDDLLLKLQRLRGPGKDVVGALTPIFAAMDTSKSGAVDASEFKTCLLALGLKAPVADVAALFTAFDRLHLRAGHRVAYVGFLRSLVDELPPIPGAKPSGGPFVSALVKPPPLPPPKPLQVAAYFPQASFRSSFGPGAPKLSDEVGDFEDDVAELERTLRDVCAELAQTNAACEAVQTATARSEASGQRSAATSSAEAAAKNFDMASLNTDISELTDQINDLSAKKATLTVAVAEKERIAAVNRQKRKDKDAMVAQLSKATAENEAQLAELQAVADQLLAELHDTEVKTAQSNGHINALLKPENPPQSATLKKVALDGEKKAKIRERHEAAAEQHRINLMRGK